MPISDVSVVLAHGAWADGSSWARVIAALKAETVNVLAAPLPLTSLADDVAAVTRSRREQDQPRRRSPLRAFGAYESYDDRTGIGVSRQYNSALRPVQSAPKLAPDGNGLIWLPEEAFETAFAQNASEEVSGSARRRATPDIAQTCISVPVARPLWKNIPSWFLVAEDDRMIAPETQHYMAERMNAKTRAHAVDHTPSVTAPTAVVDVIRDAIRSVAHS